MYATMRSWFFDTSNVAREDWWTGRTGYTDGLASTLYLLASFLPLILFAFCGLPSRKWLETPGATRLAVLAYGALVSVLPHVWLWVEASAFFDWSAARYRDPVDRTRERERFKLHADAAKTLWTSVIALYAAALLKF